MPQSEGRGACAPAALGFTLVELLTVIAIVGILMSLLLPALVGAKGRAQALRSISNARQLGFGMNLYAQDFSQLPRDPVEPGASNWVESLVPYLQSLDGLRICPADRFGADRLKARSCSYVLNYYTSGGRPATFSGPDGEPITGFDPDRNVDSFPRPAETFLAFEASNAGLDTVRAPMFDDHTHPDTWLLGWGHVLADIDPYRHGRGATCLFADWHVATTPAVTLRTRIQAGDNFARIPR